MNLLLGSGQPLPDQNIDGVTRVPKNTGEACFLLSAKALQHVIGHGAGIIGTPDAHPNAVEIECAERAGNVFETVVSPVTATKLEPNRAMGQVKIIVHNNQLVGGIL